MSLLAEDPRSIFLGQCLLYPGHILYGTLNHIPKERRIEFPVAEEMQMGASIGLALSGLLPVSVFPRMDFLLRAMDQLVNHLDKIEAMSCGQYRPKVIIRTMVGSIHPMDPGPQHSQDHTEALRLLLTHIDVVRLEQAAQIVPAYQEALASPRSTILVEAPTRREGYEE